MRPLLSLLALGLLASVVLGQPTQPAGTSPKNEPAARTFYNNVQRLKLDVQTIAPIHGNRTYPWADFARFVGSAATN